LIVAHRSRRQRLHAPLSSRRAGGLRAVSRNWRLRCGVPATVPRPVVKLFAPDAGATRLLGADRPLGTPTSRSACAVSGWAFPNWAACACRDWRPCAASFGAQWAESEFPRRPAMERLCEAGPHGRAHPGPKVPDADGPWGMRHALRGGRRASQRRRACRSAALPTP